MAPCFRDSCARAHRAAFPLLFSILIGLFPAAANPATSDGSAQEGDGSLFSHVADKAQRLSEQAWEESSSDVPKSLRNLSYDQYRNIRFRKEQAIWNDESPFEIELFHPGFLYEKSVKIHLVKDGKANALPFDPDMFSYEKNVEQPDKEIVSQIKGFSGFRIHYPINSPDYKDEIAAFQGASYFRLIGRQQNYGLSARGLAIDTALPQGEEFPRFTEFWLVKPRPDANSMTLFALLESESITGAYRFRITPGHRTKVDVATRLFARNDIERLGIAPMTSMFLFGENSTNTDAYDDHRPEIHDSDNLLLEAEDGRWIRRPLLNRKSLRVSSLKLPPKAGFGLLQADRDFDHYRDLEANYEQRPSLWVQPQGDWGKGSVQLVEIPAEKETHDNIVAFWTPDKPMKAGEHRRYAYTMETMSQPVRSHELAWVTSTHTGWAAVPDMDDPPPRTDRRFVVTFEGGSLSSVSPDQPVNARLETSAGEISEVVVSRLPDQSRWQASFRLDGPKDQAADMQLTLMLNGKVISETWNYVWYPSSIK